jgi:hypothetical protein
MSQAPAMPVSELDFPPAPETFQQIGSVALLVLNQAKEAMRQRGKTE